MYYLQEPSFFNLFLWIKYYEFDLSISNWVCWI